MQNHDIQSIIQRYKTHISYNPPNIAQCYLELANIYEQQNMYMEAITECYVKIMKLEPHNGIVLNQIGVCYFTIGQFKLASHYFKKVLKLQEIAEVYTNVGVCCVRLKEYKDAEYNFLKSYAMEPNNDRTNSSIGELYYFMKKYDESIEFYNKLKNKTIDFLYNTSFSYLAKKDFTNGFYHYENRLKENRINAQTKEIERVNIPTVPYWDGIAHCERLLLLYEQGIGDNIQYYRFVVELSKRFPTMKITYFCRQSVIQLFKHYDNIDTIANAFFLPYDYKVYIMSLPYILKISDIKPNTENYIRVDDKKTLYWKDRLSHLTKKLKVGFVYNGLLMSFIDKTIPLEDFKCISDLDIDLICMHKKEEVELDIQKISWGNRIHLFDIDKGIPFEDTVHILKNLDLLITIDTAIVHLAGVLGVKTWLLLGKYSEWRWSNTDDNYWYNSVELFRMKDELPLKNIIPMVKTRLMNLLDSCH